MPTKTKKTPSKVKATKKRTTQRTTEGVRTPIKSSIIEDSSCSLIALQEKKQNSGVCVPLACSRMCGCLGVKRWGFLGVVALVVGMCFYVFGK
ncbi:MAG: hypothetical protein H6849_05085 [Alphaproteobacteria bacterium]|nr:MAG: hypothetical protein H6849_05085 [Alphaproteobacteria bacterium]